jgi:hypothetical protein
MFKTQLMIKSLAIGCSFVLLYACSASRKPLSSGVPSYHPESAAIQDTIEMLDSLFFDAYNNCKLEVFETLISEDIEFYHDRGGLSTSKSGLITSLKNNVCGKVKRELLAGSIEAYPIPNYGAVQMGAHRFTNYSEKDPTPSRYAKFVHTWKRENGIWKLTRVISLH